MRRIIGPRCANRVAVCKKCVVVIDKTNHARSNGATATVTGTFHGTFKGPRKTFSNAVVVGG